MYLPTEHYIAVHKAKEYVSIFCNHLSLFMTVMQYNCAGEDSAQCGHVLSVLDHRVCTTDNKVGCKHSTNTQCSVSRVRCIIPHRAMVFIVLVPSVSQTGSKSHDMAINEAGFVCLVVVQCLADLMLLLALDHEQRFRSSGIACTYIRKLCIYVPLSVECV